MNKLIIGIVILAVLGVGGYFVFMNRSQTSTEKGTGPGEQGQVQSATIEIKNFKHNPDKLTVKP